MKTRDAESVLVTGASGFIGQHLVRRLIERGDRVSCLVRPRRASTNYDHQAPNSSWAMRPIALALNARWRSRRQAWCSTWRAC